MGKYIDINGDGIPEGVIFADLAVGGEGQWGNFKEKYKIPTIEDGLKDYIVIGEYNDQINGKQEVLAPILDGIDRFYIMALNDVGKDEHYWYNKATFKGMIDYEETTLETFGSGKQNTLNMIKKWNKEDYGAQDSDDMWSLIQEQVNDGWFILSVDEWAAFAGQLGITKSNYSSKGLSGWYWSSSQYGTNSAFSIYLNNGYVDNYGVNGTHCVRLAATF
ncbi:hypothetical protein [Faecalibacillus intestinalis]|uniref:hypothetical protein n=1 Tax=Faecalibacillus intestinalis TaxID=1982626 RepID=UPI0022E61102|nr:hypothetical protein [Faecalibacillus intestinalis]